MLFLITMLKLTFYEIACFLKSHLALIINIQLL